MDFLNFPREIQMEIIQAALPKEVEIVSENSSGRYQTTWQQQWVAGLRLVSRSFSVLATDKIVKVSRCHVHETRKAEEIAAGASSLPEKSTLRIDMFPDVILQGCKRLIITQQRTDVLLPSDCFDISAFNNLELVRLDTKTTTAMLGAHQWLASRLARPAEEQTVQPMLAALRKLLLGRPSIQHLTVDYDYPTHTFFCVFASIPNLNITVSSLIDVLCNEDDKFCHDLIKIIGSDVLGFSRTSVQGLKDDARVEAQFWAVHSDKRIPVSCSAQTNIEYANALAARHHVFWEDAGREFLACRASPTKASKEEGLGHYRRGQR